jgi:hypothetical protein
MFMLLEDERVNELVVHCRTTLQARAVTFKIIVHEQGTVIPVLKKGSMLNWRPVLDVVSTFPIQEEHQLEFEGIDLNRPLFYCEIRGQNLKDMKTRYKLSRRGRRNFAKRGRELLSAH